MGQIHCLRLGLLLELLFEQARVSLLNYLFSWFQSPRDFLRMDLQGSLERFGFNCLMAELVGFINLDL